jgi:hypothetical protein
MCESYSETENWEKIIMERSSCSKRRSRRKELRFKYITPCRGGNWSRNRYNGSVNGGVCLSYYCDFYFSAIFCISMTVRRQLFFPFLLLLLLYLSVHFDEAKIYSWIDFDLFLFIIIIIIIIFKSRINYIKKIELVLLV